MNKLFDKAEIEKSKYGCPCSTSRCCATPDLYTPEHECTESVCEDCYVTACHHCGKSCACDL